MFASMWRNSIPEGLIAARRLPACMYVCLQKGKLTTNAQVESKPGNNIVASLASMRRKRGRNTNFSNADEIDVKIKQTRLERNLRVLRAASKPTADLPVFELAAKLQSRA